MTTEVRRGIDSTPRKEQAWHRTHPRRASAVVLCESLRPVLLTERLKLRALEDSDSGFIIELLNDPAFLEYIGDRGVRSADQAREYIAKLRAARTTHGYALYGVALLHENTLIGLCGLVRRDTLPNADLGFAFLPAYRKNGYARESALAVLNEADSLGVKPLLAICSPDNVPSRRLLEQLGFRFERMIVLPQQNAETCLYSRD
jgi:RimJ/RimL family protein N-acetyltransferase